MESREGRIDNPSQWHVMESAKYKCAFFEKTLYVLLRPKPRWMPRWAWRWLIRTMIEVSYHYKIAGMASPKKAGE